MIEQTGLLTEESRWDRLGFVSPNSAIDNQVRTTTARLASAVKQPPRRVNQLALFNSISPEKKPKTRTKKQDAKQERLPIQQERYRNQQIAKQKQQEQKRKRKEEEAFRATPAGKARTAKDKGHVVFQFMEVLTETKAEVIPMVGAYARDEAGATGLQSVLGTQNRTIGSAIEAIESEGWRMVHAGYVFQQTYAESRDKFLASGQQVAIAGRVLGIYTFRLVDDSRKLDSVELSALQDR